MDKGTFWFVMVLIAGGFVMFIVEWLYRKLEPKDDYDKNRHLKLMEEIKRHDGNRESTSDEDRFPR